MRQTDLSLLEQMRITEFEVEHRKALFLLDDADVAALLRFKPLIEARIDALVDRFYQIQTAITEIALLIGDADTLRRLRNAQRRYILDLFSGNYDLEYVNNRLRIGLVHKRIGVEPKLYLSATGVLKALILEVMHDSEFGTSEIESARDALAKLMLFDITLVFETYIRSLVSEIEAEKDKSDLYARSLEEKVKERTRQLEELTRIDPLTGLYNVRIFSELLTQTLNSARRRSGLVTLVYLDVDDFKKINDTEGHQRGDEVLRSIGQAIKHVARAEDICFRYGGDEFCIILPDCSEQQAEDIFFGRLGEALDKGAPGVTISVGIAETGPGDYDDPDMLVMRADKHMYETKKARKAQRLGMLDTVTTDFQAREMRSKP